MDSEIQPADPEFRKIVVLSLTIVGSFAVVAAVLLEHHLGNLQILGMSSVADAAEGMRFAARSVFAIIALGATLAAAYMGWLSMRIYRSERFPPPGGRVIADTRILRGAAAKRYATMGFITVALFLLAAVLIPWRGEQAVDRALAGLTVAQPEDPFADR